MKKYKITIDGDIPSKKNKLRGSLSPAIITFINSIRNRKINLRELYRYVTVRPSQDYIDWEEKTVKYLMTLFEGNLFLDKVKIDWIIYFSRKGRSGGDTDNKKTSLQDALVGANILTDDHYEVIVESKEVGIYRKGQGGAEIIITDLNS